MPLYERPTKIGKYEILATLGRGGMGVVYKARDPRIDRVVAIKTILLGEEAAGDESLLDRLHMEARSAGRLQHPSIVTIYDFGEEGDLSYIVMEFVEGVNLARLIDEGRQIPLDTKLSILIQIADGLGYAHEHGVIHRDMKPSNVCVTSRGAAKILDFGLARFDSTRLTKTGYMAGTIAYMSPERLSGTTGVKDDIFALGAIAYELLTHQRAFPGTTAPEVMSKIVSPKPPPSPSELADIPKELDAIVLKALAKDIDARYDSASALADDMRRFARSLEDHVDDGTPTAIRSLPQFEGLSALAYSGPSSTNRFDEALPTLQVSERDNTAIAPDVKTKGVQTAPEVDVSTARPSTQVTKVDQPRRAAWLIAAAAIVVITIAGSVVVFRRPVQPPAVPQTKASLPHPLPTTTHDPIVEQSELQLATARSLSDELSHRHLTSREILHFSQAKARIALAERKMSAKDYDSGARLIAEAITGLQEVMSTSDQRMQPASPTPQPKPQPKKPVIVATAPPPRPVPVPVPAPVPTQTVAAAVPTPAPAPVPQPRVEAPPPPAPAVESPEKEIAAFMHQLAAAYQARDVAFFRQHSLRFSEQLANAIRNSPSVKVDLQILRIDLTDPQHASVSVKRTDWFPDSGAPPAVQTLVYKLERESSGWQISAIGR